MLLGMFADRYGRQVGAASRLASSLCLSLLLSAVAAPPGHTQTMAIPGGFGVDATGAATYKVPISMPPSTAGMGPTLSLEYSSQRGTGLLGVGWTLGGLPSINRCPRTIEQDGVSGSINFDGDDRFCLDGQRLIVVSGSYGADGAVYRTEVDAFSKIVSHGAAGTGPAWFEVYTKSGQIMEFGRTADSLILAQGKTTARIWAMNRMGDSKANYLTATYINDVTNSQYYPSRIDYTGNATTSISPYNSIQFAYVSRPDIVPQYQAGSMWQTAVRMTNITTYAGTNVVADYRLSYQTSSSTGRSILTSLQVCDGVGTFNCLPSTSFIWQGHENLPGTVGFQAGWGGYSVATGDFNGDGKTDIFLCPSSGSCYLYYVNGSTLTQGITPGWGGYQIHSADFNGDLKTDLFVCPPSGSCYIYYSTGTSFAQGGFIPGWGGNSITVGDFNGDGRADLITCPVSTGTCYTYYSTGTSFVAGSFTPGWGGYQLVSADFNGDGKSDIYVCEPGSGTNCYVFNSTGSYFAGPIFAAGWGGNRTSFGDFNGDGLTDVFSCPTTPGAACYVYFSTGSGLLQSSFVANWGGYQVSFGDLNGDGKADLFACPSTGACGSYFSTGTTFVSSGFNPEWTGYAVILGDWSGIGAAGLLVVPPSGTATQFLSASIPELIIGINNGMSATAITYSPMTNSAIYTKDSDAVHPRMDLQSALNVAIKVETSNGIGGTNSSTYAYAGAKADTTGRGFLGFRQLTVTDTQTGIIDTAVYRQDFPFNGLLASTKRMLGSQTLAQSVNTYQFGNASGGTTVSPSGAPYRVSLSQRVSSGSDLDGSVLPTITSSFQYDSYNNPTQIVVSASDGYSKTTTNTYVNDAVNWHLGRLSRASVTSVSP